MNKDQTPTEWLLAEARKRLPDAGYVSATCHTRQFADGRQESAYGIYHAPDSHRRGQEWVSVADVPERLAHTPERALELLDERLAEASRKETDKI